MLSAVTAEGDYYLLCLFSSKYLLKSMNLVVQGNKKQHGQMEYLNILLGVKEKNILEKIRNTKPISPKNVNEIMNFDYLKDLHNYRSLSRIYRAYSKFQKLLLEGIQLDLAINQCSFELLEASRSQMHKLLLDNFINFTNEIEDKNCFEAIKSLCYLFGVQGILDQDWLGLLDSDFHQIAQEAVYYLIQKIRPNSLAIVESFDFPEFINDRGTIGRGDGNVYESLCLSAEKSELNKRRTFLWL